MNKTTKQNIALLIFAAIVLLVTSYFGSNHSKADSAVPEIFSQATNGSSTCGQFSNSQITIGPSAAATSTGTGIYQLSINGTVVTSTSQNTSTAASTVAGALLTSLTAASTTLKISAATTSANVISVTSTVWGAFLNTTSTVSQNGLTVSSTYGYPSTIIVHNYLPTYMDFSNGSATGTYIGLGQANLTVGTGHYLPVGGDFNLSLPFGFTGPIACIAASSSNATVSYINH